MINDKASNACPITAETRHEREGFRMQKKVLITGGGGYIGRHVVTAILDTGAKVIACDVCTEGIDQRATRLSLDIFSGDEDIFRSLGSPDICLHMAWKDGFVHNAESHMLLLSKHYAFLGDMIRGGLCHLAVMGTMHEVGYFEGAIDETTPCNPSSMYGIAKDALRRSTFLMAADENIVLQWLRAFYIYGDDQRNQSIFAKLIQAAQQGKTEFPFTTGKSQYDFLHVLELGKQIAAAIQQTEITGIINCCSGKPVPLADKVEQFIEENHLDIRLLYGAYPDRMYDSPAVWGDNQKIQAVLAQTT